MQKVAKQLILTVTMMRGTCCIYTHTLSLSFADDVPPANNIFDDGPSTIFHDFPAVLICHPHPALFFSSAYITCKKICNQTAIDENPVDPVTAPSGCNAYQNPEGASYEYRCFAALPILPDERGQGGHGPGSATADHTPPTTSKTPLIVVGSLIMLAAIWPCVNIMKRCRVQAGPGLGFEPLESGIIATLNENFVGNDHDYGDDEEEDDDVFTRDGADGGADKSSIRPEGLQRSPALPMRGSTDA